MRAKSEMEERDRYAKMYASVLAAESMVKYRTTGEKTILTLEAEDTKIWDDIHEIREGDPGKHFYQVKRQQVPLESTNFSEQIVSAAKGDPTHNFHLTYPVLIEIKDVGEIRVLRTLTKRIQQPDVNKDKVLNNLRQNERNWINWIKKETGLEELDVLNLLKRLFIHIVGYEEDLENRAYRALEPLFGRSTVEAWDALFKYLSDKDGVVDISPGSLINCMPAPAADDIDAFYWYLIQKVEQYFWLSRWATISDMLVRNILPIDYYDDLLRFIKIIKTSGWPKKFQNVEGSILKLSEHTSDYVKVFKARSEQKGKYLQEDVGYKRIFPNPNYQKEAKAAEEWDAEVQILFANIVVALNELFEMIRSEIKSTYRLREGRLVIHDSLGIRNDGLSYVYYSPKEYTWK